VLISMKDSGGQYTADSRENGTVPP